MGTDSKISWTHHTWNLWRGCSHALLPDGTEHPGCHDCYAEMMSQRNPKVLGEWGPAGHRGVAAPSYRRLPYRWQADCAKDGRRERVFMSLGDPFEDREDLIPLRAELFQTIDDTPNLDWLLLTKRPQDITRLWPGASYQYRPNVWLLYSASDQPSLEAYVHELMLCRRLVPIIGISAEPLLGPLNLTPYLACDGCGYTPMDKRLHGDHRLCKNPSPTLDWVIYGGESDQQFPARPCQLSWIRAGLRQCQEAGVPAFMKQLGSKVYAGDVRLHTLDRAGANPEEWPEDLDVQEFPKGSA